MDRTFLCLSCKQTVNYSKELTAAAAVLKHYWREHTEVLIANQRQTRIAAGLASLSLQPEYEDTIT